MSLIVWSSSSRATIVDLLDESIKVKGMAIKTVSEMDGQFEVAPGDVILVLGKAYVTFFEDKSLVPKNRSIGWLRSRQYKWKGAKILFSYSPYSVKSDYTMRVALIADLRTALRLSETGTLKPDTSDYFYVNSYLLTITNIKSLYRDSGKPVRVSMDLETVTTNPWAADTWIVSVSISIEEGHSRMIYFDQDTQPVDVYWDKETKEIGWTVNNQSLFDELVWLLNTEKVVIVGANFKYDLLWLWVKWGITCNRLKFDTTLAGSLLDENRSNSLNTHAKLHTDMGGYDDEFNNRFDKSAMNKVPKDQLLVYGGGDTDACLRVSEVMKVALMKDSRLKNFYTKVLNPASLAFLDMESEGVLIDVDYLEALGHTLDQELDDLTIQAYEIIPPWMKAKYMDDFKLTRSSIIKDYVFGPKMKGCCGIDPQMETPKGDVSTASKHLKMFQDDEKAGKFISILGDFNVTKKTRSTYVTGFLAHLRLDNRLHPTAIQYRGSYGGSGDSGTVTGRTAFRDPAMQCMVGETLVLTDDGYVSLESIVAAHEDGRRFKAMSHDGTWKDITDVYRNGVKKVYRIITNTGKQITCTGNHPIMTTHGWVLAKDLTLDDTVISYC